jgi:hypothetical protein
MIHGRQQQTATPMTQASATQKTTKKTSKPRKTIHNLQITYIPVKGIQRKISKYQLTCQKINTS